MANGPGNSEGQWNEGGARLTAWDKIHKHFESADEARMRELDKAIKRESSKKCRHCLEPLAPHNGSGFCRLYGCRSAETKRRRKLGICVYLDGCPRKAMEGAARCEAHFGRQQEYRVKRKRSPRTPKVKP